MKRALIFGVSGQDGAYLSQLLLAKGYEVHGTSRDAELQPFRRLHALGVRDRVHTHSISLRDFRELLQLIGHLRPDEIYNLAAQSSVGLSFSQPIETMESIAQAQLLILEVIRYLKLPTRLYHSSSSECFGESPRDTGSDESSPFFPRSPYATAKATAHWETANYREAYGIYACSGITFNHESELRGERYVTRKILDGAAKIARGEQQQLILGDLAVSRDWGYAPEYVEAMWLMLQQDAPEDYVIATGESHTVAEFAEAAFRQHGLDWKEHVVSDPEFFRPSEIRYSRGNAAKAKSQIGWQPRTRFQSLLERLKTHVEP
jgi:GDPmannose 4,6-dehydratase